MSFNVVSEFEENIADFYGSPYAVSIDSCTHGIELCLRYLNVDKLIIPKRTYISIPFLANKLDIPLEWRDQNWQDYYQIGNTKVYDAAVLWKKDSYIPNTFMCLSFQFQKHLNLGRGGMILTDDRKARNELKKMSYDGRVPDIPWRDQNIDTLGYHYYMTPETAQLGLDKLEKAKVTKPKKWVVEDWPDLTKLKIFR